MRVEDTILRATWLVAATACGATLLWLGLSPGLGVALGAALSLLNLYWLRAGADAYVYDAVARAPGGDPGHLAALGPRPKLGLLRFSLRFVVCAAALYAIFMSHLVPFPPVLGGLLAAPAGVMAGVTLEAVRGWRRGNHGKSA